jgi:hypothetical protein
VHAPRQVDVEDVDELVAPLRVVVAADRGEQRHDVDVGAHNRVQDPLEAEVGHALEAMLEGVDAGDGNRVGWGHALAREQAEECRFAGAVGWGEVSTCSVSMAMAGA